MLEKVHMAIVFILSTPLMAYHLFIHTAECIQKRSDKFSEKLFMRRFNLIDSKHVDDFIRWNNKYHEDRENEKTSTKDV